MERPMRARVSECVHVCVCLQLADPLSAVATKDPPLPPTILVKELTSKMMEGVGPRPGTMTDWRGARSSGLWLEACRPGAAG